MRAFVRGDLDGFFGLALDNLVQLLLIDALCRFVLGFPPELLYGRVLPACAISLVIGNLFYAWQAHQLAKRTGRTDVCALPYGINTISLIAHVFLVMLPVKLATGDPFAAWRIGLVACLGSGVIELAGSTVAERIRKATPRAALLSTLAGIALGFISGGFLLRTFAHPIVGLATFGVVLLVYFGGVRFKGGIPGGLVAVGLGTALAWMTGLVHGDWPADPPRFYPPTSAVNDLLAALGDTQWMQFISVILPMGLFNLIGSLQNIESAEAAGDLYPTGPSLAVNGLGSVAAACFGSCFPTTIYIGHPGWKALGARAGYSTLNGLFFCGVCLFGLLGFIAHAVPVDAGMAIVLWIGIVIAAQAFQATPREHAPAVVVGLLPGLAAWVVLVMLQSLAIGRELFKSTGEMPLSDLAKAFESKDIWLTGALALDQGFIFTSSILAATTVALIEKRFHQASIWCAIGAVLSACGLMHAYRWDSAKLVSLNALGIGWNDWATGYCVMAAVFFVAPWLTEPGEGH
jgi:AGZA family xanthine/uracil permease-like MFS transporter